MSNYKNNKTEEKMIWLLGLEQNLGQVMEVLHTALGLKRECDGNNFGFTIEYIDAKVTVYTSEMSEEIKNYVDEQTKAIWSHFRAVEAENTDVQINLLYQLQKTNFITVIQYCFNEDDKNQESLILNPLIKILPILKGVMIIEEGSIVLGEEGHLILSNQGESQVEYFMPYEKDFQNLKEVENMEGRKRREQSLECIYNRHIYVPKGLPFLETEKEVETRSAEEVAGRATALLMVSLYSECLLGEEMEVQEAREFVHSIVERFGADKYLSLNEKAYLENPNPTDQERIHYSWQYEDLFIMEWALGLIDEIPFPDTICDVPLTVRVLKDFESMEDLLLNVKLRTNAELLDAADMIFCLDWACVDARVYGLLAPAGMEGGITMERHKSLNWLIGFDENAPWDEVDTPT